MDRLSESAPHSPSSAGTCIFPSSEMLIYLTVHVCLRQSGAVLPKHQKLGALRSRLRSCSSGGWPTQEQASSKFSPPVRALFLPSCCVLPSGERELWSLPLPRRVLMHHGSLILMTASKPSYPWKARDQLPSHCGLGLQHMDSGGTRTFSP